MKVFISHAQADRKWAELLESRLDEQDVQAWSPKDAFGPGENWALAYGRGLEKCDAMIVLFSPETAKSEWVQREIDYALSNPRFRDRLIGVMVEETEEVPWIVRKQRFLRATKDMAKTAREIAAALRAPESALAG